MVKLFTIDQSWHDLQGKVEGPIDIVRPLALDKVVTHIDNDVKKKTNIILKEELEYKICEVNYTITEAANKNIVYMQLKAFYDKAIVIDIAEDTKEVNKEKDLNDVFIEMYESVKSMVLE